MRHENRGLCLELWPAEQGKRRRAKVRRPTSNTQHLIFLFLQPSSSRMSSGLPPPEQNLSKTGLTEGQVQAIDEQRGATVHVRPAPPSLPGDPSYPHLSPAVCIALREEGSIYEVPQR